MKSGVWGNQEFEVTQGFGVNLPGVPDEWYAYAADWGLRYGDHVGIDVGMPKLTPIFAAADGVVTKAGMSDVYRPKPVHVTTPDNPTTQEDDRLEMIYGHLWENTVVEGQMVKAGDLLGYSGEQTVRGTMEPDGSGPHLHFEVLDIARHVALDPTGILTGTSASGGVSRLPNTGVGSSLKATWSDLKQDGREASKRVGLALLGLPILAIGLYVAFPAVRDGIDKASSIAPAGRAVKLARGARKVSAARKAATAVKGARNA